MSTGKPCVPAATCNSPLVSSVSENNVGESQSSTNSSFRSPFLLSGPPDVFNSPSVKCVRSAEPSRRRSSPFPQSFEHSSKRMKMNSSSLPDSRSRPPEPKMSLLSPAAAREMSQSLTMLFPLSPIRSPLAEEKPNLLLPEFRPKLAELDDASDLLDHQVKLSSGQVCSDTPSSIPESSSLLELPWDQVKSESDSQSCSSSRLDDLPLPETPCPSRHAPVVPDSPASGSSPLDSSPPPQPELPLEEDLMKPEIRSPSPLLQSGSSLPESAACSSTALPDSESGLPSSDSPATGANPANGGGDVDSGEKLVDTSCSPDTMELSVNEQEFSPTKTSCSASSTEGLYLDNLWSDLCTCLNFEIVRHILFFHFAQLKLTAKC